MRITRKSRLSIYKKSFDKTFFVWPNSQNSVNLYNVNRKTVAFFSLRLKEIIAFELEAEIAAMFSGEIEVDVVIFTANTNEYMITVLQEKSLYFGCLSVTGRSIPR